MKRLILTGLVAASLLLTACGNDSAPPTDQALEGDSVDSVTAEAPVVGPCEDVPLEIRDTFAKDIASDPDDRNVIGDDTDYHPTGLSINKIKWVTTEAFADEYPQPHVLAVKISNGDIAVWITSYDGGLTAPMDDNAHKYSETGTAFPQSYYETQGLSSETPGYQEAVACVS